MIPILKIFIVFVFLVILIKKKIQIGYTLLLGSIFLGILFTLPLLDLIKNIFKATIEWDTLHLLFIVILVTIFGGVLKFTQSLRDITDSLENLVKDTRTILALLPALIGILPMPGGAMMSAPMIQEVGSRKNISPEIKAAFNYWFRHIMEFVFPLYQGVIIASVILKVPVSKIILAQVPMSLTMLFAGVFFLWRKVKVDKEENKNQKKTIENLLLFLKSIWGILLAVALNLFSGIDLLWALLFSVVLFAALNGVKPSSSLKIVRENVTWEIIMLILGIMIFKKIIEVSGAVTVIPQTLSTWGISPVLVICLVPFAVGALTGVTTAFIGISYPILLSFLKPDGINYGYAMLAYAAGFTGVMASPVHLCLVLTKDYFKATFSGIYKLIIPPSIVLMIIAVALVLLGYPWGRIG
jgi:integral membrane protein (TIGR00529 family)